MFSLIIVPVLFTAGLAKFTGFDVPDGAVAQISMIDSTLRFGRMKADYIFTPVVKSFDYVPEMYSWSFLIESSKGEKVLFDLGVPPNIESYAPATLKHLEEYNWDVTASRHVADTLEEHGIYAKEIRSVIWSHHHWDHIGDIRTFPNSTELVVGPGFQDAFLPGWPTDPDSTLREDYFTGRKFRELDFANQTSPIYAGTFQAIDFFGDGSFFLLDAPGHDVGHLAGLARTSKNPDTFIFLGGDLCHHAAELRPSRFIPYPDAVPDSLLEQIHRSQPGCPGAGAGPDATMFPELNEHYNRSVSGPLFVCKLGEKALAVKTIRETQIADAQDNVFVMWAHNTDLKNVVDQFPKKANQWHKKGWREEAYWMFLKDITEAAMAVHDE